MIEQPLPTHLYLDTGTVAAAIMVGSKNSRASAEFCDRLVIRRSCIYFSQLLLLELSETIKWLATKPDELPDSVRSQHWLDDWETSVVVRRQWMNFGVAQLEAFLERFEETFELPLRKSTWLSSVGIMAEEQMRSYDALHVATGREARFRDLATTDRHFRKIDDLTIWLTLDHPNDGSSG